jgi:hypothetical protein
VKDDAETSALDTGYAARGDKWIVGPMGKIHNESSIALAAKARGTNRFRPSMKIFESEC